MTNKLRLEMVVFINDMKKICSEYIFIIKRYILISYLDLFY